MDIKKPEITTNSLQKPQATDDMILDLKYQEKKSQSSLAPQSFQELFDVANAWLISKGSVSVQDKLLFFQLLEAVVHAGVSINEGLRILESQTPNPRMKLVVDDLQKQIEAGHSLADGMRINNDIFDEAEASVIESGEKSGKLREVLREIAVQLGQANSVGKKVKSVLMYPMIVFGFIGIVVTVVLIWVIPALSELFGGAENLPLPTRIMMNMSDFILYKWWLLLFLFGAGMFLFKIFVKSPGGRTAWGRFRITFPVFGSIVKGMILAKITRILGFLIASGVSITEALRIAANVAGNPVYKDRLMLTADDIKKGIPIAENLADDEQLFPPMLVQMVAIGEKTASLEGILSKIADYYTDELERKIGSLSKLMEPFVLLLIAVIAGFIIAAIFMPILQINDAVLSS